MNKLQKGLINPTIKTLLALGLAPPMYAMLETTGPRSGQPRQTPIGNGLDKDGRAFWIVTEHGLRSAYVRNIAANPRVRVKIGRRWRSGTAQILPQEDPRERQRTMNKLNGALVRLLGTDHLAIRIDLDGAAETGPR